MSHYNEFVNICETFKLTNCVSFKIDMELGAIARPLAYVLKMLHLCPFLSCTFQSEYVTIRNELNMCAK